MDTVPLFPDIVGLTAHFATRRGGVSRAPFESLNLGFSTRDAPGHVVANRSRLADVLTAPLDRWVVGGQVHGADVIRAGPELAGEGARAPSEVLPAADAVFLPEPGVFALALSADCPLVAVVDPGGRRAGIAHAGWRGTAAGVVDTLVDALVEDGTPADTLRASVSPGICGSCYEVGDEVFGALEGAPGIGEARRGRTLDLRRLHHAALRARGIPASSIRVSSECSACSPERYFSHRRDRGRTGRNGALVGWR